MNQTKRGQATKSICQRTVDAIANAGGYMMAGGIGEDS